MNKKIIIALVCALILISLLMFYFFYPKNMKTNNAFKPLYIAALHESLVAQNINIDEACKDMTIFYNLSSDYETEDAKERLIYLCEDQLKTKELKTAFDENRDYRYFLECAKSYSNEVKTLVENIKTHYPEDYKTLYFDQENLILKYIKHPQSAYYSIKCEAQSEALYWSEISQSSKIEDLNFCINYTEKCLNGTEEIQNCPVHFKDLHKTCLNKYESMKAFH